MSKHHKGDLFEFTLVKTLTALYDIVTRNNDKFINQTLWQEKVSTAVTLTDHILEPCTFPDLQLYFYLASCRKKSLLLLNSSPFHFFFQHFHISLQTFIKSKIMCNEPSHVTFLHLRVLTDNRTVLCMVSATISMLISSNFSTEIRLYPETI